MIKIDYEKMGGLIPAVIQDAENGEVLMVAFMDEKTLNLTLETGKTWFFSRSRNKYWMKGEESGNTQEVVEVLTDCDADTVVIKVKQDAKEPERASAVMGGFASTLSEADARSVAAFLASRQAAYVTGSIVRVDGGLISSV